MNNKQFNEEFPLKKFGGKMYRLMTFPHTMPQQLIHNIISTMRKDGYSVRVIKTYIDGTSPPRYYEDVYVYPDYVKETQKSIDTMRFV